MTSAPSPRPRAHGTTAPRAPTTAALANYLASGIVRCRRGDLATGLGMIRRVLEVLDRQAGHEPRAGDPLSWDAR